MSMSKCSSFMVSIRWFKSANRASDFRRPFLSTPTSSHASSVVPLDVCSPSPDLTFGASFHSSCRSLQIQPLFPTFTNEVRILVTWEDVKHYGAVCLITTLLFGNPRARWCASKTLRARRFFFGFCGVGRWAFYLPLLIRASLTIHGSKYAYR